MCPILDDILPSDEVFLESLIQSDLLMDLYCQISVVIGYWRCNRRNHSIEMTKSTFRIHIRIHHQDKSNVERVRTQVKYWSWSEGLKSAAETRVCQVEKYLIILFGARKNYSLHLFSRKEQFKSLSLKTRFVNNYLLYSHGQMP